MVAIALEYVLDLLELVMLQITTVNTFIMPLTVFLTSARLWAAETCRCLHLSFLVDAVLLLHLQDAAWWSASASSSYTE